MIFHKTGALCRTQRLVAEKSACAASSPYRRAQASSIRSMLTSERRTGAGIGNVRDQVLPSSQKTAEDLYRHCKIPKTVSIVGAPMTYGQPFVGTDSGPSMLRELGLLSKLSALGWRVEDHPDLDFDSLGRGAPGKPDPPNAKNCSIVGAGTRALADTVEDRLKKGLFPLVVGGDHSIGIGSLAGILRSRPNTGVLWIDAHADINTPLTSPSGNLHGMPIGLLMEGVAPDLIDFPGFEWLVDGPRIRPDSVVYVGLRDVDAHERNTIRSMDILAFTMHEIDRYGIGQVMEMALAHLMKDCPNRPLHLSFDIDAVDPVLAPATGTTVRGGLTFREAHYVAEAAAQTGNLISAEIVEVNPSLAPGEGANETAELGLQLVTSMMGKSII